MDTILLYEEYRLIERSESEVSAAWKGAHLLFFFLAFVFGSFCTFCFHMLMYMFDEKCVLFPKLLSLTLHHKIVYEFFPDEKTKSNSLPVDFFSTQWMEQSACYFPTYVPLVSGIFGLVWTTMFLMYSTSSRTLTGLQRSWRVLPAVFIFSFAMSGLCIYTSTVTHQGLEEFCLRLGEGIGISTCSFAINVATLAYERRIRGVYQATQLTILSAWLHTTCWILSTLLAFVRIVFAIDFQMIHIKAELQGNLDKMLEHHEQHLRTVSPDMWLYNKKEITSHNSPNSEKVYYMRKKLPDTVEILYTSDNDTIYFTNLRPETSELSLVPDERKKLARLEAYKTVEKDKQFIVKILYDLLDTVELEISDDSPISDSGRSLEDIRDESLSIPVRQYGQENILSKTSGKRRMKSQSTVETGETEDVGSEINRILHEKLHVGLNELSGESTLPPRYFRSKPHVTRKLKAPLETTHELDETKDEISGDTSYSPSSSSKSEPKKKKPNLKNSGVQTEIKSKKKKGSHKVHISESKTSVLKVTPETSTESVSESNKETQTTKKEKQD